MGFGGLGCGFNAFTPGCLKQHWMSNNSFYDIDINRLLKLVLIGLLGEVTCLDSSLLLNLMIFSRANQGEMDHQARKETLYVYFMSI